MFFLEHADLELIARRLGPQARAEPVAEDLRGWRWYQPPLSPIFDPPLSVEEVADTTCPTGRDIYLTRVLGVEPRPTREQLSERALRRLAGRAVVAAKAAIYQHGARAAAVVGDLEQPPLGELLAVEAPAPPGLAANVAGLWAWERARLAARIGEAAAAQPDAGADALVALVAPVTVGRRVDGRFLGLTDRLEADAVLGPAPLVTMVRFGPARPSDRLLTTGLALALEATHDAPVDLGCLTYGRFADGLLSVTRDLHVIDDELRQQFIEARDEKARLVQEEIDPGLPDACPDTCPFRPICHEGLR